MKIVKLPADYVRYLNEGKHVVFNNYEYWVFLKDFTMIHGTQDANAVTSKVETLKR